jgi:diaminopimelate epimerase
MQFTKMHGTGNDYVYVDCFSQSIQSDLSALAVAVSDRHTGIGADGLILIHPSDRADARMQMFNADGSEAEMCGNGVRCVAKYVYDHGLVKKDELTIETRKGVLTLQLQVQSGRVGQVRVNMGPPILNASDIPTRLPGDPPLEARLEIDGRELTVSCVSMGNPHCIVFVDDLTDAWVLGVGPHIERHPAFPQRTNAEFVRVIGLGEINVRVWERGTGETRACGTGACAALVAGVLNGRTERTVIARLPGGDLHVEWAASGDVFLTGPAVEVFRGWWPVCS